MNFNKAIILGNVTRQPEVRALPSGKSVASFGVATNRFYTDASGAKKQEAEFHNVVCFGKLADISSRYLNKGSMVLIEGRIKTNSWQSQSGEKKYRTEIIAENLQLAPKSMGGSTPRPLQEGKSEEIPIIEENYNPPSPAEVLDVTQVEESTIHELNTPQEDEIDVKDIPF